MLVMLIQRMNEWIEWIQCLQCQHGPLRKIRFKFRRGSMPVYIPDDYIACIGGCDDSFNRILDIRFPRASTAAAAGVS